MELFQQAVEHLRAGEVNNFAIKLIEFYNHLTCNCVLRNLKKDGLFEELLSLIEKEKTNEDDFYWSLSKGYILSNFKKEEDQAFTYLSKAIEINPTNDLAYTLRSSIDKEINPKSLNDIRTALELNPTAGNNFRYAASLGESDSETKEAILFYKKAIYLNPNFACAHLGISNKYRKLNDFDNQIRELELCIEIEPNHWGAYYNLWVLLNNKKEYQKAYQISKKGYQLFPKDSIHIFAFGIANYKLNKFQEAIKLFKNYLKIKPESEYIKKLLNEALDKQPKKQILKDALQMLDKENYPKAIELIEKYLSKFELFNSNHTSLAKDKLQEAKNLLIEFPLKEAMKMYRNRNYSEAIKNFEKYLETESIQCRHKVTDAYFFSLLKTNNIEPSEENLIYKNLLELTLSYFRKNEPRELWYFNTANDFDSEYDFEDVDNDDDNESDDYDSYEQEIEKNNEVKEELQKEPEDMILTEDEENANKLKSYNNNSILNFGKYEGQKISTIINLEPSYILWCINNLIHFSIDKFLLLDKKLRMQDDYLVALESNYIKGLVLEKRIMWKSYKKWLKRREKSRDQEDHYGDYYYSNPQKDTFDALTDGQYGDYEDWREDGGNIDNLRDELGL